jgi:hypothetical protein
MVDPAPFKFQIHASHMDSETKTTLSPDVQEYLKNLWANSIERHVRERLGEIMKSGTRGSAGTVMLQLANERIPWNIDITKFQRDDKKLQQLVRTERFASTVHTTRSYVTGIVNTAAMAVGVVTTGALGLLAFIADNVIEKKREEIDEKNQFGLVPVEGGMVIDSAPKRRLTVQRTGTIEQPARTPFTQTRASLFNVPGLAGREIARMAPGTIQATDSDLLGFSGTGSLSGQFPQNTEAATEELKSWARQHGFLTDSFVAWSRGSMRSVIQGGVATVGMGSLATGVSAYVGYSLLRFAYSFMTSRNSYDVANDHLTMICRDIASEALSKILNGRRIANDENNKLKLMALQTQLFTSMIETNKIYIETQERIKRQEILPQVSLLKSLERQFENENVTPFEMIVFAGYCAKEQLIDFKAASVYIAGKAVDINRYYNADQGELVKYLLNLNRIRQLDYSSMDADEKKQVEEIINLIRRLRDAEWSEDSIRREDWDKWAKISIRGTSLNPQIQKMTVVFTELNGMLEDSAYPQANEQANKCVVMDTTKDRITDKNDMWFEKETVDKRDLDGDANFRAAKDIFLQIISNANWNCSASSIFNSYQALWLFRWMGPMCSRWIEKESSSERPEKRGRVEPSTRFLSETCRKRYAFLKTILSTSLLFPFVRPREALAMFQDKSSCIYDTLSRLKLENLEIGSGYGMLLLSNCSPGTVTLVGYNFKNAKIQENMSVGDFVTIESTSPNRWSYNPVQIIENLLTTVERKYNIKLLANECWKSVTYETPSMQSPLPTGETFITVKSSQWNKNLNIIYEMSRNASILSLVKRKNSVIAKNIDDSGFLKYYTADMKSDVERKINTYTDRTKPFVNDQYNHSITDGTEFQARIQPASDADRQFEMAAKSVLSETTVQTIKSTTARIVNDGEEWKRLFKDTNYANCVPENVIFLNQMCVNPFALCVYVQGRVIRIFGDIWFLQPIIASLTDRHSYRFRRFQRVQEECFENLESQRVYLQDILYLNAWQSLIGISRQV